MYVYIEFNSRKSESQSQTQYAMNKMFEVKPPQGHKPRIPQIPQVCVCVLIVVVVEFIKCTLVQQGALQQL